MCSKDAQICVNTAKYAYRRQDKLYRANQWQNTEAGYGISVKNVV